MEKAGTFFHVTEKDFFVRHLSEYETSGDDRKVNRNVWPDTDGSTFWYIFQFTFRSLSHVSYFAEFRTSKLVQYGERMLLLFRAIGEVL